MKRAVHVRTDGTQSEWDVKVDLNGDAVVLRDGKVVLEVDVGQMFHVGALLVEAAAKGTCTKTLVEVGPNLRKAPEWSSFSMRIPTDADGNNTLDAGRHTQRGHVP